MAQTLWNSLLVASSGPHLWFKNIPHHLLLGASVQTQSCVVLRSLPPPIMALSMRVANWVSTRASR